MTKEFTVKKTEKGNAIFMEGLRYLGYCDLERLQCTQDSIFETDGIMTATGPILNISCDGKEVKESEMRGYVGLYAIN